MILFFCVVELNNKSVSGPRKVSVISFDSLKPEAKTEPIQQFVNPSVRGLGTKCLSLGTKDPWVRNDWILVSGWTTERQIWNRYFYSMHES